MMLKIYLAEDQVMIAQALKTLLELEDDLKVIGTATDGKQALKDIIALKPDIALLDIEGFYPKCSIYLPYFAVQRRERPVPRV